MPAECEWLLKVVLCWHMHQPQYQDLRNGEYQLPWSYLHSIKDYADMAAHLESQPEAHAVINFGPVVLEQIADYAKQVRRYLEYGGTLQDPLLAGLGTDAVPKQAAARYKLIKACLRANEQRIIHRFPAYRELVEVARGLRGQAALSMYLTEQFLVDLVVWYHLAWLGESIRRKDKRIQQLIQKGRKFTMEDRVLLIQVIGELLGGLIGRYRTLAERGQVELSMSPYAHPILPLLLDFNCALETTPEIALPRLTAYPHGESRAREHIRRGLEVFRKHFESAPIGCWPAEAGVSTPMLRMLSEHGFKWVASAQRVLQNSLTKSGYAFDKFLYRPYRLPHTDIACFFRDDGLSDLIAFSYADWHAEDAVADLIRYLENITQVTQHEGHRVVPIILDGENAWEYYPENGYRFLATLYRELTSHPLIELVTFSEVLDRGIEPRPLPEMVAGSWIGGSFSTWIGYPAKNRAWDMLCDAERAFDAAVASGQLDTAQRTAAEQQLLVCEGSDWFWWFGQGNLGDTVSDFERLFQRHLLNLYSLIRTPPPDYLL
jgi:alpha-amylase/alpha-mannosidase (GH57 family)